MKATRIIRILLVAEITAVLCSAVVSFRDYQDSWILEGLEVPFAVLAVTYLVYIFVEKDIKRLLLFSIIFRSTLLLIPQLKYAWFQGVAIDQQVHYRLAKDIYDLGFIPSGRLYSGTPLMHVFFASYSLLTGFSVADSFKYLPILWWASYPLLIYLLLKKSDLGKENPSILKYAVVIACIPSRTTLSYVVVTTLFGAFLVFLFLYQLTRILQTNDSRYWLLGVLCGLALVMTHAYSSITLLIVLSLTFLVSTLMIKSFRFRYLRATLLLFLAVLNIAWLLYQAPVLFGSAKEVILNFLKTMQGLRVGPPTTGFSLRFFQLDPVSVLRVLAVFHGADLLLLFFMLLGILLVARKFLSSMLLRFLSLYVVTAWAYYAIQMVAGRGYAGALEYTRIFEHTLIWSPILVGLFLYYLEKKIPSRIPAIGIISLLIILAPIQLYGCQPLVPSAQVVSKILPSNEPVVYVDMVNSVYQRSLIQYAESHIKDGLIAADRVTDFQTIGLTAYNFSETHSMRYYPFQTLIDNATGKREYDYFLIHFVGKAGILQEAAEIRTTTLIEGAISNSSVTYTNGESYILQEPFMFKGG